MFNSAQCDSKSTSIKNALDTIDVNNDIAAALCKRLAAIAKLNQRKQEFAEASFFYAAALEIADRANKGRAGINSPINVIQFAKWQFELANIYVANGYYDDAETLYCSCLSVWREYLGSDHKIVTRASNAYRDLKSKQKDPVNFRMQKSG